MVSAADLDLGYRRSSIGAADQRRAAAELALARGRRGRRRGGDRRDRRAGAGRNQPGGQNAGSVFTNPPGDSAGRLIDAAGLQGPARRHGRACRPSTPTSSRPTTAARPTTCWRSCRWSRVRVRDGTACELAARDAAGGVRMTTSALEEAHRRRSRSTRGIRQRRIEVRREEGRRRLRRLAHRARCCVAMLALAVGAAPTARSLDVDHVVVSGAAHTTEADVRAAARSARASRWPTSTRGRRCIASRRCRGSLPRRCAATGRAPSASTWSNGVPVVATPVEGGGWRMLDVDGHALGDVPAPPPGVIAMSGPAAARGSGPGGGRAGARRDRRDLDAAGAAEGARRRSRLGRGRHHRPRSSRPRAPSASGHRPTSPPSTSRQSQCSTSWGPTPRVGVLDVRAPEAPVLSPT